MPTSFANDLVAAAKKEAIKLIVAGGAAGAKLAGRSAYTALHPTRGLSSEEYLKYMNKGWYPASQKTKVATAIGKVQAITRKLREKRSGGARGVAWRRRQWSQKKRYYKRYRKWRPRYKRRGRYGILKRNYMGGMRRKMARSRPYWSKRWGR